MTADPVRVRMAQSMRRPSPLDDVAEAVAAATEHEHKLYIERSDAGYRWSLVHKGGAYPLLRIFARFLKADHHTVVLPFAVRDGLAYIPLNDEAIKEPRNQPRAGGLFEFGHPISPAQAKERILEVLG